MRIKSELPSVLKYHALVIENAARDAGLDFFDVVFELLDARAVNGVAAYGGFPVRYPSWRFGMDYERLQKGYDWGLSKIYELVINNDPTYAYLVRSNSLLEQKLVMAHVFGHADFFKHNVWFAHTDRRMLDTMGRHSTRVRRLIDQCGQEAVESFFDVALSLEGLIDPFLPQRQAQAQTTSSATALSERRLQSLLEFGSVAAPRRETGAEPRVDERSSSDLPTLDVLGFLMEQAPLEPFEREILAIVREEAYYFSPQRFTKVINEGWACFWHSRILTGGLLEASEIIDFADTHAGATAAAPGQFNPYKLGLALWRHAERAGHDLFMLRSVHNDISFIDMLVDEDFVMRYHSVPPGRYREAREAGLEWAEWKQSLLRELTNGGQPRIQLVGDQHDGRRELLLEHLHDGRDLEHAAASETLLNIERLWRAPVALDTLLEGERVRLRVEDGKPVVASD